jgi:hypothetical protein
VGPRAVLDAAKRKIASPRRESNPDCPARRLVFESKSVTTVDRQFLTFEENSPDNLNAGMTTL